MLSLLLITKPLFDLFEDNETEIASLRRTSWTNNPSLLFEVLY